MHITKILEEKSKRYKSMLENQLKDVKNVGEVYSIHSTLMKDFYMNAFKPDSKSDKIMSIDSNKMSDIMTRMDSDIFVAHTQLKDLSQKTLKAYQTNKDYRTSLRNKMQYLNNILSNVQFIDDEDNTNTVIFKDSLSNYNMIDTSYSSGIPVNISTAEGVATISSNNDEDITHKVVSIKVSGNGEAGNYHNIKKISTETRNNDFNTYIQEKSNDDAKDNPLTMVDGDQSTWFEYQKISVPEDIRKQNGIEWGTANRIREDLYLKIEIELESIISINWIDISPYLPTKDVTMPNLVSIKLSTDGSTYQEINKDSAFSYTSISSQGILNFPIEKAKFIEILIKKDVPYPEIFGTANYTYNIEVDDELVSEIKIDKSKVTQEILEGPVGKYRIN